MASSQLQVRGEITESRSMMTGVEPTARIQPGTLRSTDDRLDLLRVSVRGGGGGGGGRPGGDGAGVGRGRGPGSIGSHDAGSCARLGTGRACRKNGGGAARGLAAAAVRAPRTAARSARLLAANFGVRDSSKAVGAGPTVGNPEKEHR